MEKVRREKMQVREKVGKSPSTVFFPMICGSGGSKSRFAKAAGAKTSGQMRNEQGCKRTRFLEDLGCKPWISESFSFDTGCFRESDCLSKRETEPEDDLTKDKREVRRRGKAYVASSSWTRASEEVKRPKRTSA